MERANNAASSAPVRAIAEQPPAARPAPETTTCARLGSASMEALVPLGIIFASFALSLHLAGVHRNVSIGLGSTGAGLVGIRIAIAIYRWTHPLPMRVPTARAFLDQAEDCVEKMHPSRRLPTLSHLIKNDPTGATLSFYAAAMISVAHKNGDLETARQIYQRVGPLTLQNRSDRLFIECLQARLSPSHIEAVSIPPQAQPADPLPPAPIPSAHIFLQEAEAHLILLSPSERQALLNGLIQHQNKDVSLQFYAVAMIAVTLEKGDVTTARHLYHRVVPLSARTHPQLLVDCLQTRLSAEQLDQLRTANPPQGEN